MEDREREGGRLAAAGLGGSDGVHAAHDRRDARSLHRRRMHEAERFAALDQPVMEAKILEGGLGGFDRVGVAFVLDALLDHPVGR